MYVVATLANFMFHSDIQAREVVSMHAIFFFFEPSAIHFTAESSAENRGLQAAQEK